MIVAESALVLTGQNAGAGFVLAFFVAAFIAIDWCFWPRSAGSLERRAARRQARADARRADYRRRLIEAADR